MSKKKFKDIDFYETCDKLWQQFAEDRQLITEQYKELKGVISGSADRYAVSGDTLAKYAELMTKQTAQLLEFIKVMKKEEKEDNTLSEEELQKISEELKSK